MSKQNELQFTIADLKRHKIPIQCGKCRKAVKDSDVQDIISYATFDQNGKITGIWGSVICQYC